MGHYWTKINIALNEQFHNEPNAPQSNLNVFFALTRYLRARTLSRISTRTSCNTTAHIHTQTDRQTRASHVLRRSSYQVQYLEETAPVRLTTADGGLVSWTATLTVGPAVPNCTPVGSRVYCISDRLVYFWYVNLLADVRVCVRAPTFRSIVVHAVAYKHTNAPLVE